MLSRTLIIVAALTTLIATPALAQENTTTGSSAAPFIGLGVELENIVTTNNDYTLYVPINLTPQLRIEPLVTLLRTSSTDIERNNDNTVVRTDNRSNTSIGVGVGGFYMWSLTDSITAYGGGRLQYLRSNTFTENILEVRNAPTTTTSISQGRNNFLFQGAIGTEWYFTRFMSIGGEGQFNIFYQGTPTIERDSDINDPENTSTSTTISPEVSAFFRFYFM